MASVSTQHDTGLRRIIFRTIDGRRVSLYVGRIPKSTAYEIAAHIDHLVASRRSGSDLRRVTSGWIDQITAEWPRLASRLAQLGLIPQCVPGDQEFAAFVDKSVSENPSVKPNTLKGRRQSADKIRLFFRGRRLRSLTALDGTEFVRWLRASKSLGGAGHSEATAMKHLSHAKMFLEEAVRAQILSSNPFQGIRSRSVVSSERRRYIPESVVMQVLDHTADIELQTAVSLSRWGGLRIPSEAFALEWQHVDWHRRRMTVPGVKTKCREIPLFPELAACLSALKSASAAAAPLEPVLPKLRNRSGTNLRNQLVRLVRSAGVPVWPKIFHNLRSSRQTDLEERFPRKTVCEWMGNSELVADRHYLQVREEHFERAAAGT